MHAAVVVAVVAVIGLGGSSAKGGHHSATAVSRANGALRPAHPTPGLAASMLRALALDVAKRSGDAVPSSIELVRTTHREAWRLLFPGMPSQVLPTDETPVDFVVMTGHFTDRDVGPGNVTVTGTQLHLVVDMHGNLLDGGLDHLPAPNLGQVGTVTHLDH